jgi:hypothetical protein
MAKEIEITDDSHIRIDDDSVIETRGSSRYPFYIRELQNIAPIAAHIKEVNHIDPISVDSLHVSEVRNIEPINISRFNVTNLPMMNMSLRKLPPVNLNIRELPAVSLGTHQVFEVPSDYLVRARFLGFEVLRLRLRGRTEIAPRDRYRREQSQSDNRSYAEVATAGNPAIPSTLEKRGDTYTGRVHDHRHHGHHRAESHGAGLRCGHGHEAHTTASAVSPHHSSINPGSAVSLSAGMGGTGFNISPSGPSTAGGGSSVSSGG